MLVISTAAVPFFWTTPDNLADWGLFAVLGIAGGLGHFFMVKAYQLGQASIVGPFDYGQLIGATLLGFVMFNEFPDLWTWVGAALLIGSGLYVARREAKLAATSFDLVLSDVQMPRMDGIALVTRVKQSERTKNMPVVLVSSLDSDEDRRRGLEAGADAYLGKSDFRQELLLETLDRLI